MEALTMARLVPWCVFALLGLFLFSEASRSILAQTGETVIPGPVTVNGALTVNGPFRVNMPWGFLKTSNNELHIMSTVEDPPAIRLGARSGGGLGSITWGRLRDDSEIDDLVVLWQGKIDERYRDKLSGEVSLHIRNHNIDGGDDRQFVQIMNLRADGGHAPEGQPQPEPTLPGSTVPEDCAVDRATFLRAINLEYGFAVDETMAAAYCAGRLGDQDVRDRMDVRAR